MRLLKKYRSFSELTQAFLPEKEIDVKLYSFKHIGASYLVHSKVVDILQLKEHLRHSNLSATEHYVKRILGDKNDAIRSQFPNPLK